MEHIINPNPYDTSYGKLINTKQVREKLLKYLVDADRRSLSYEYKSNQDVDTVFIIGYNEAEHDLPIFNQPIVIQDARNNNIVAVDLRKYVNKCKEQPYQLSEVIKDKASCDFLIAAGLTIADFTNENYGEYRPMYKPMTQSLGFLFSSIVDRVIKLSIEEIVDVEIIATYYANLLLSANWKGLQDSIVARMSNSKFTVAPNKKNLLAIVENSKFVPNELNVTALVENIKYVLPDYKAELISEGVIINLISNMWFGPGGDETVIMGLECMPLWNAFIYSVASNSIYKRTRMNSLLDRYSKQLGIKEFVSQYDKVMADKKLM